MAYKNPKKYLTVDQLKRNINSMKKNKFIEILPEIDKINFEEEYMFNPTNWTK